jgi:hypothetical protein
MAIVLGGLGAAAALTGLPGLFLGQYVQRAQFNPAPPPNMPNAQQQAMQEMQELQDEMNRELVGVGQRYFWFGLVAHLGLLAAGIALLVGGLWAMSMKRKGAGFLGTTFMFTSVFDVARLILSTVEGMESAQIAQKHLGPMMEKMPNRPGFLSEDCISNSIQAGFGGLVCFSVVWTVFKLWLYLSGWMYFNKPDVQALLKD